MSCISNVIDFSRGITINWLAIDYVNIQKSAAINSLEVYM